MMGLAIKGLMDGVIDNQNQWLDWCIVCWRHSEKGDGNGIKHGAPFAGNEG
jgi:hypothetical protein